MNEKELDLLNLDLVSKLKDLKESEKSPSTKEAMKALSMVGQIMNTIMNGAQVDPVFIKKIIDDLNKKMATEPKSKKIIKKKKFNRIAKK